MLSVDNIEIIMMSANDNEILLTVVVNEVIMLSVDVSLLSFV